MNEKYPKQICTLICISDQVAAELQLRETRLCLKYLKPSLCSF